MVCFLAGYCIEELGTPFPKKQKLEDKMKALTKIIVLLGALSLPAAFASGAPSAPHREITMWVSAPTGSLLRGGYASTYLTNIRAKSIAREDPKLQQAINSLDGLGMLRVRGLGLVPAAVAWQSNTSINQVVMEQAETRLSYAELLMAHTLAAESNHGFNQVIAMRVNTQTWAQVAEQLGVDPDMIILRAKTASDRIRLAQTRTRQRALRDSTLQNSNPHIVQRHIHY